MIFGHICNCANMGGKTRLLYTRGVYKNFGTDYLASQKQLPSPIVFLGVLCK